AVRRTSTSWTSGILGRIIPDTPGTNRNCYSKLLVNFRCVCSDSLCLEKSLIQIKRIE
uniref:Uncharacterized protein n=1 Tax=Anopheles atroparvus TaxID=41427 RepID=A0AAG5D470_ANOAO